MNNELKYQIGEIHLDSGTLIIINVPPANPPKKIDIPQNFTIWVEHVDENQLSSGKPEDTVFIDLVITIIDINLMSEDPKIA